MSDIWARLERDFGEQLAGITPPVDPLESEVETRARLRDASPIRPYPPIGDAEL